MKMKKSNPFPYGKFCFADFCGDQAKLDKKRTETGRYPDRKKCPKTGQPDYGTIVFTYVPDKVCVELKSLKMYLQRFRNEGIFYEAITNRILDDFVAVVQPRQLRVESRWTPRGGLNSNIIVEYPHSV